MNAGAVPKFVDIAAVLCPDQHAKRDRRNGDDPEHASRCQSR